MACLLLSLLLGLVTGPGPMGPQRPPNVLVIVMDDIGVDKVGAYGEHPDAGPTPTLDLLASRGVLFRNAWGAPTCSPARATSLTGRYPFRHGIGTGVHNNGGPFSIPESEHSLPEALRAHGYRTAAIGKWHLGSDIALTEAELPMHPIAFGFERYVGSLFNVSDYYDWERTDSSPAGTVTEVSTAYATTQQVDDALAVIGEFGRDPWFLWLAFSAPHKPVHAPPAELHTQGDLAGASAPDKYRAMVEALDNEIRRLLASLPAGVLANTQILVYGDNGTYSTANTPPFGGLNNNKGNLREGGVNVPLIAYGPRLGRGESTALVTIADVYPTVLELARAAPASGILDGTSFLPQLLDPDAPGKDVVFMQRHKPNGFGPWTDRRRAVRDERFKLIRRDISQQSALAAVEFFDLLADPFELNSLVNPNGIVLASSPAGTAEALAELQAAMDAVTP
jgi:arylsulfatase A-like enzyme